MEIGFDCYLRVFTFQGKISLDKVITVLLNNFGKLIGARI